MIAWIVVLLSLSTTPTQADISSRLSSAEVKTYDFKHSITTTHERSHILNANTSQHGVMQAVYLGKGKFLKLPWPKKVRLSDVAARVPKAKQGHRYQTYLVDQQPDRWQDINGTRLWIRGREDNPLYILDEFQSYIHGAKTGLEEAAEGIYPPNRTDLFVAPMEMYAYVQALVKALQELEPEYLKAHPELISYVNSCSKEVTALYNKAQGNSKLRWTY